MKRFLIYHMNNTAFIICLRLKSNRNIFWQSSSTIFYWNYNLNSRPNTTVFCFLCVYPPEQSTHSAVCRRRSATGESGPRFGPSVCKERHQPGQVVLFLVLLLVWTCMNLYATFTASSDLNLPVVDSVSSGGRGYRSLRASWPTWRRSLWSSPKCWNSRRCLFRKLASSCRRSR